MTRTLLALTTALLASPAPANTLVDHVNGIQVGADGTIQHFRALLINDQGKVVETIATDDAVGVSAQRHVDGEGRTLLPGLIDAHGHVMALGRDALRLDVTGTRSIGELQQ